MKFKRFFTLFLAVLTVLCAVVVSPAYAEQDTDDVTKTPAGEMEWETNDARNMFREQVMTLSRIAETLPIQDGIIRENEYLDTFPISVWDDRERVGEVFISYKEGFLYMGVKMKSGAPIHTQIDFGNASCNSPYVTVNRTTQQIMADGTLSPSGGQLIRCNDGKEWTMRGNHPTGDGAKMLTKAAASRSNGVMTFEYVADVVKLMEWFAQHEAYYDAKTELLSRAVTWQCWGPESDTGKTGVKTQFTCQSSAGYLDIYFPGQTITWNWAMYTIVLPEAPAAHLCGAYEKPPIGEMPTLQHPEDETDEPEEITTTEPTTEVTETETITEATETATTEPATTQGDETRQSESGCKGGLTSSAMILAVIAGGAVLTRKKRKNK